MERLGQTMLKLLSLAQVIHQEATELLLVSMLTKSIARKRLLIDDFSQETLKNCFITPISCGFRLISRSSAKNVKV